jgi:putative PIN family toxin of toxin-antitoxin system
VVVVIDANVFISAALSAHGPSAILVRAARDGILDVVVSPRLLGEVHDVLGRPHFRRFLTLTEVDELLEEIGRVCRIEPDPDEGPPLLRDPDDGLEPMTSTV